MKSESCLYTFWSDMNSTWWPLQRSHWEMWCMQPSVSSKSRSENPIGLWRLGLKSEQICFHKGNRAASDQLWQTGVAMVMKDYQTLLNRLGQHLLEAPPTQKKILFKAYVCILCGGGSRRWKANARQGFCIKGWKSPISIGCFKVIT